MPSTVPYPEAPKRPELTAFISGSDREPNEKDKVGKVILNINTLLVNDGFDIRIVRFRTQPSLNISYPTAKANILEKLYNSQFFIGIASSHFNPFTALEWRIAFSRYTNPNCKPRFEPGTVFFLTHNDILQRLEKRDEEEGKGSEPGWEVRNWFHSLYLKVTSRLGGAKKNRRKHANRFRRFYKQLTVKKDNRNTQYYQCRSYVTDREDSEDHLDHILNVRLFAHLHEWFLKHYGPKKATEPTRGPDMILTLGAD